MENIEVWKKIPVVATYTDYTLSEELEQDINTTDISWIGINAALREEPQEELEKRLAIQEQIQLGVIDELGIPTGFSLAELGVPIEQWEAIEAKRREISSMKQGRQQVQVAPPKIQYNNKLERAALRERAREDEKKKRLHAANAKINNHTTSNGEYSKFKIPSLYK
jgi:hypothetical protein